MSKKPSKVSLGEAAAGASERGDWMEEKEG